MFNRRKLTYLFTGALVAVAGILRNLRPAAAQSNSKSTLPANASRSSAHLFFFSGLKGETIALNAFSGKVILIVNTASFCGFTNQFKDLQTLYSKYQDRGLVLVGVPSNDFYQEPGSSEDIAQFCSTEYGVTFPMAAKTAIRGEAAHPFYKWAAKQRPSETPKWNFFKYLVDRDGTLIGAFGTTTGPLDASLIAALEAALSEQS